MDNLTHTLTGLMLSRAGLNRWCPRATPLLLIAVNLPDADIVTRFGGVLNYLDHHRGITHSLAAAPLLAAAAAVLLRLAGRKPLPWLRAVLTALIGVLSHLLMDWSNVYGIRLLLPFEDTMWRLDVLNIVDLSIWGVLLLSIAGPALSRLVSSEIGARSGTGQGAAVFGLMFVILYSGARCALHERAIQTLNSHLYRGEVARRVAAFPHLANPLQWTGLVEGSSFVILHRMNLLLPFDPTGGATFYPPQPSHALDVARNTDTFVRYLRFSQFPFFQVTPADKPEGGMRVQAMDLRFGDPAAPRFVATAVLDAARKVVEENYTFGPLRPR
ncbi:MAG: metal-dependent hydrolase [Acidobacteria bacterium]|nr:metal-dependent hydrolase [Acidobacteriota bacterium]